MWAPLSRVQGQNYPRLGRKRIKSMAASPPSSFSASLSSSSSLYPSSCSSIHSPPLLSTNLSPSSWSPSHRPSAASARHQLESLIAKHGHPIRVSLSSLRDLTATSSTYSPPSPLSPRSPASEISELSDTVILSRSTSRPIPIPKPPSSPYDSDLPVTPLTGRFEKDYFPQSGQSKSWRNRESVSRLDSDRYHRPSYHRPSTRMRSDSSSFYSPVMSPSMSPSTRSASPQPTRSRPHNSAKSVPAFHLGSLPRFHPAVYQPSNNSQSLTAQPPSPRHSRQQSYWTSSGSRDTLRQYGELVESATLSRAPSRPLSPSPSAPRLDPLRSPGPVTPLALEETGGYLTIGATSSDFSSSDSQSSSAAPDLVEKLIAREVERDRQKSRKSSKNW
ncbi:hypothetical protein LV164_004103 [Aspergillus fumigatus]|nr:hypothetical protein LV157_004200 [Aspergillus fumigatus]KAJ8208298.1 hypothetical protein LV164_004103 [Aspergillus fumigatus]KEY79084.1 hypothetical protein BA78_3214 [Aspergillus fumigatus]